MGQARRIERINAEDYLAGEQDAETRHEYVDGELFAMVGASRAHDLLSVNFAAALKSALVGKSFRVTVSDMKVRLPSGTRFYYPDVMVSCSDPRDEPDAYYETRPELIVEILSSSTEAIDRREKRLAYATIESLRVYVLVAQEEVAVELYRRDGGGWSCTSFGLGDVLALELGSGVEIAVAALYDGVPLANGTR